MTSFVVAERYVDRAEALIAQSILEAAGVSAFLPDFHFLSVEPGAQLMVGGFRLLVLQAEAEMARAILQNAQSSWPEAPTIY